MAIIMPLMNIDISLNGTWHPCADLALTDAAQASRTDGMTLRYDADYAPEHLLARDLQALSVRLPVVMAVQQLAKWPSFLIDLLPQGAARKRLERIAGGGMTEWTLLERGAINPVGNLRVHPSAAPILSNHPGFTLQEMLERGDSFIDHAYAVGATVSGSTDTQGEAPKFWVVQDAAGRWHPDNGAFGALARRQALLKFPVPEAGPRATDMLRCEAAYQRVAKKAGLRVTADLPAFAGNKALLIPRFDRRVNAHGEVRLGVESIYSICGVLNSTSEPLRHHTVLIELSRCVNDFEGEMIEYMRRDILNLALGNRDNHGRNTAILKETDGTMRLSPIYDLGPTFLDARNIARNIRWDAEPPGEEPNWTEVLLNLETRFEDVRLKTPNLTPVASALKNFANTARELPQTMRECGVDEEIIEARRDRIVALEQSLREVRTP